MIRILSVYGNLLLRAMGQTLVLASDGVTFDESLSIPDTIEPTGPLADRLLRQYGSTGEDDATLAVIRLEPMKSA